MSQPLQPNINVTNAYIALGSNVTSSWGGPLSALKFAISQLATDSVKLVRTSCFYSTPAFPKGADPDFVNAVLQVETNLAHLALLSRLHEIEAAAGRVRLKRWDARVLDLDLISFGDTVHPNLKMQKEWVDLPLEIQMERAPDQLILPHPRIQDRAFVLVPLRDVAPNWTHPATGQHIDELIAALSDDDVASVKVIPDA
ncbi:MAG: 2-amino-4-hydroxy-6-hydroxymethyldihydropteridine diphosphokinase [Litoreibacter sp.]